MTARRAYRQEERSLQQEIMLRLRSWAVLVTPCPNGLWIPARNEAEKALVARIINQMKRFGMLEPGALDLSLGWPGGWAWVEIKRPASTDLLGVRHAAGQLSKEQREFAERVEHFGGLWAVVRSWDEMHAKLVEWQVPAV